MTFKPTACHRNLKFNPEGSTPWNYHQITLTNMLLTVLYIYRHMKNMWCVIALRMPMIWELIPYSVKNFMLWIQTSVLSFLYKYWSLVDLVLSSLWAFEIKEAVSLFVKDELITAIFQFFNIMSCYIDWYLLLPYMLSLTSTSDFCHVTCIFYCRILILARMIWMISLVDLLSLLGLAWEIYMGGFAWYLLFV